MAHRSHVLRGSPRPVLLTKPEEFDTWMRGSAQEAMTLVREYPPEQMHIVQTSYEKED